MKLIWIIKPVWRCLIQNTYTRFFVKLRRHTKSMILRHYTNAVKEKGTKLWDVNTFLHHLSGSHVKYSEVFWHPQALSLRKYCINRQVLFDLWICTCICVSACVWIVECVKPGKKMRPEERSPPQNTHAHTHTYTQALSLQLKRSSVFAVVLFPQAVWPTTHI